MKHPRLKYLRYTTYILTFMAGTWGGTLLINKLTHNTDEGTRIAQAMVDKPAPEFRLADLQGITRNSHEWDGKVLVVNFWATWCPPCRSETPLFVELQERLGPAGLQFVGIAIDDKDKVEAFMDTYGVNYPMLIGEEDAIEASKRFGNRFGALPYTVIIDRQGMIRHVRRGELKREVAEESIGRLL